MYLLQVLNLSCILSKFWNYDKILKSSLRKFISIIKYTQIHNIFSIVCANQNIMVDENHPLYSN
jgi:hypothetical protein